MARGLLLVAIVLASSGCGGIISSVFIIQGSVALAGARAANAENLATYEYVSAEAYLKKAREAHSYSDFEHSLRFARLASERASIAKKKALDLNKPQEPVLPPPEPVDPNQPPPQQNQPYQPPPATQQPAPAPPPVIIRTVPEPAPAPATNTPPPAPPTR
jgi:hypothetical protein